MIVTDANIIAYLFLEGEHTDKAEMLLKKEPHWAAPLLWRSEFRNVLALYIRKKILSYNNASEIMEQAELLMHNHEYTLDSEDVLFLASSSTCSSYDCEYAALAKKLETYLITEDKQLLKNFPKMALSLSQFLGLYN